MIEVRDGLEVLRSRSQRISWKVPAFCCNDWAAIRLLQYCEQMNADRPIDIAYGAPLCAWSGGRPSAIRVPMTDGEMDARFKAYADHGVKVALTLSRLEINESLLDDAYCERLLCHAEEYRGEAIVVDDKLAAHIKEKHPGIRVIASLNKSMCELRNHRVDETDYYRELLNGSYDEVVVRCEYALDNRISALKDVADQVEVIVNQFCVPECKTCYEHIRSIEEWNIDERQGQPKQCFHLNEAGDIHKRCSSNLFISEKQFCALADQGFKKLKMAGRNAPLPSFLEMLATYVFEPTGVIGLLTKELKREFRSEAMTPNSALRPWSLPDSL